MRMRQVKAAGDGGTVSRSCACVVWVWVRPALCGIRRRGHNVPLGGGIETESNGYRAESPALP